MNPFFSVILPSFNRAHLLPRALESLEQQTFLDFEAIIIDDGSRDNTREVAEEFINRDKRIHYHYTPNRGLAGARNLGIEKSRGEYITFLDSDDEYLPEHLALRAEVLKAHPEIDLLHGGVEIVGNAFVADKHDPTKQVHLSECVIGGTFFIKRFLVQKLNGFGEILYGDDSDFFERSVTIGANIQKVDFPTYRYYRTESDSLCAIAERDGVEGILKFRSQAD